MKSNKIFPYSALALGSLMAFAGAAFVVMYILEAIIASDRISPQEIGIAPRDQPLHAEDEKTHQRKRGERSRQTSQGRGRVAHPG